jgi:DeoR/GlpR family transcriptional regulator of sugar metabolism
VSADKKELVALSPEERQTVILERINVMGRVLAAVLAQEFGVSEDSIRRDLRDLSDAGLVQRFHGGAARLVTPALDFRRRETLHAEEKQAIGGAAAASIPDGATLLVDSSTTVVRFVRALPPTLSLRIITTAIDVAAAALDHSGADVIMLGGRLGRLTRSATGVTAVDAVRALRVDYCVLGTCGVAEDLTLRADDYEDALLKSAMIRAAAKTLLLAPADKLGQTATYEVAPISVVSTLFTIGKDTAILKAIRDVGVDVETV